MHIEHIALWTRDIERLVSFYEAWFEATAGRRYVNDSKGFKSCFVTFPSGARLEIMCLSSMKDRPDADKHVVAGYSHIAFSTGSEEEVDLLTRRLKDAGHTVVDGPRRTGDGYYESVVLDPDGNRIEITI